MNIFNITGSESCKRCGENARTEVERLQAENNRLRELVNVCNVPSGLAADVTDKIIPLWEYVADVAKQLNDDAFANMEGADGDVFQLMDELASCAYSLKKIAEKLKRIEDRREKRCEKN